MELFRGLIFCTCFLILAAMNGSVEACKHFKVGDHIGWQQPSANNTAVYSQWATSKRFRIGDSLSFSIRMIQSLWWRNGITIIATQTSPSLPLTMARLLSILIGLDSSTSSAEPPITARRVRNCSSG